MQYYMLKVNRFTHSKIKKKTYDNIETNSFGYPILSMAKSTGSLSDIVGRWAGTS